MSFRPKPTRYYILDKRGGPVKVPLLISVKQSVAPLLLPRERPRAWVNCSRCQSALQTLENIGLD